MHAVIVINYVLLSAAHYPGVYIDQYKTNVVGAWSLCGESRPGKNNAHSDGAISSHSSFTRVTIRDNFNGFLLSLNRFLPAYLEDGGHDVSAWFPHLYVHNSSNVLYFFIFPNRAFTGT
jgi:hypothetical protein